MSPTLYRSAISTSRPWSSPCRTCSCAARPCRWSRRGPGGPARELASVTATSTAASPPRSCQALTMCLPGGHVLDREGAVGGGLGEDTGCRGRARPRSSAGGCCSRPCTTPGCWKVNAPTFGPLVELQVEAVLARDREGVVEDRVLVRELHRAAHGHHDDPRRERLALHDDGGAWSAAASTRAPVDVDDDVGEVGGLPPALLDEVHLAGDGAGARRARARPGAAAGARRAGRRRRGAWKRRIVPSRPRTSRIARADRGRRTAHDNPRRR